MYNKCLFTCGWSLNLLLSAKLPPVDIFILVRDIMQIHLFLYLTEKDNDIEYDQTTAKIILLALNMLSYDYQKAKNNWRM